MRLLLDFFSPPSRRFNGGLHEQFIGANGKRATAFTLSRRSRAKSFEYSPTPHVPIQSCPFRKYHIRIAVSPVQSMSERDSDPTLKGQRTAEKRRLLPACANALEIWSELKLILVSLRSKMGMC
jgi:hypothetical protein